MPLTRPKKVPTENLLGTFSASNYASGMVVQAGNVPAMITRNASLATDTYTAFHTINITPKTTNSRIIFLVKWQVFHQNNANHSVRFRIKNTTSNTVLNSGTDSGINDHDPYTNQVTNDQKMAIGLGQRWDDPASTSQQTYEIQFSRSSDRSNTNFSHNSANNSNLQWFEIIK